MKPGVYFDLPEAEYHAAEGLSSSGIKRLMGSTMDFWAGSWMNPDKEEDDTESFARMLGKAHHVALLEAKTFGDRYCLDVVPEDAPEGTLRTALELKARCKEIGLKVTGTKDELVERILEAQPRTLIWETWYDHHVKGRQVLKPEIWRRLAQLRAVGMADPVMSKALSGGQQEVSIFWDVEGVPCKARIDYWKPKAIVDVKTFANPDSQPVHRAILRAMARYHYHVQAVWYGRAVSQAVKSGLGKLKDYEHTPPFVFVFAQTGPAPVVRTYVFPRSGGWQVGETICDQALVTYAECVEQNGSKPWIDQLPLQQFDDGEFPAYMWD